MPGSKNIRLEVLWHRSAGENVPPTLFYDLAGSRHTKLAATISFSVKRVWKRAAARKRLYGWREVDRLIRANNIVPLLHFLRLISWPWFRPLNSTPTFQTRIPSRHPAINIPASDRLPVEEAENYYLVLLFLFCSLRLTSIKVTTGPSYPFDCHSVFTFFMVSLNPPRQTSHG